MHTHTCSLCWTSRRCRPPLRACSMRTGFCLMRSVWAGQRDSTRLVCVWEIQGTNCTSTSAEGSPMGTRCQVGWIINCSLRAGFPYYANAGLALLCRSKPYFVDLQDWIAPLTSIGACLYICIISSFPGDLQWTASLVRGARPWP